MNDELGQSFYFKRVRLWNEHVFTYLLPTLSHDAVHDMSSPSSVLASAIAASRAACSSADKPKRDVLNIAPGSNADHRNTRFPQ